MAWLASWTTSTRELRAEAGLTLSPGVIVARHLPQSSAGIEFVDAYPPMASTPGNLRLLEALNGINRDLGLALMAPLPPERRGASDAAFVAQYVDVLSGLDAQGSGAHAPGESVDLASLPVQIKRAALLMYRLTR